MKRCQYSIPLETRITESNNIGFSSREVFLLQETFSFVTATLSAVTDTQSPLIFPALVAYFNLDVIGHESIICMLLFFAFIIT